MDVGCQFTVLWSLLRVVAVLRESDTEFILRFADLENVAYFASSNIYDVAGLTVSASFKLHRFPVFRIDDFGFFAYQVTC